MNSISKPITIRAYRTSDAAAVTALFQASVRHLASRDYTDAQRRAWAPDEIDHVAFGKRCECKSTWIAEIDSEVGGFSDFEPDGHIDMLYVHPDFHRRGIARGLLEHIETLARDGGLRRLYTEASITARPAFEKIGFRVITQQIVTVRGESMPNFRMEKQLNLGAAMP